MSGANALAVNGGAPHSEVHLVYQCVRFHQKYEREKQFGPGMSGLLSEMGGKRASRVMVH